MNMNTEEILMVDDERAIRLAVRTALTREGMHVTEAADGSTALDLLKQKHFDLVILDVMMENVSGYQVLQTMRAWGDHTPVMMLSGKSDEMDQVLGLGFGADSYLTKPFHTSVLIQTAKALIRRNQIYSQASEARIHKGPFAVDTLKNGVFKKRSLPEFYSKGTGAIPLSVRASGTGIHKGTALQPGVE